MPDIPFKSETFPISENVVANVFEIMDIDEKVEVCIDRYFSKICRGSTSLDIEKTKKRLRRTFSSKIEDEKWIMGATAEFFVHLWLNLNGFRQQCLFMNLEERSIKKGFDGYYTHDEMDWIMESKSGSTDTEGNNHKKKLNEALKDLKKKLEGGVDNNIWQNAVYHAMCISDSEKDNDLIERLNAVADKYEDGEYDDIKRYNLIPCATIFLKNRRDSRAFSEIKSEISDVNRYSEYGNLHILCVTQKTCNFLINYLEKSC